MDADHIDPEDKDEYERNQNKTFAEHIAHLNNALARIANPNAFYVATSKVDPEVYARMVFAQCILDGYTLEAASAKTAYDTRERYAFNRNT